MDFIKVAKVPDVTLLRLGNSSKGTLHLTTYHLIFSDDATSRELWVCYPIVADVERRAYSQTLGHSSVRLRCRDFTFVGFNFSSEQTSKDVFDTIMKLTCVNSVDRLYAYMYKPGSLERKFNSWAIYDPIAEYTRMGALQSGKWRVTSLNEEYKFSPSYPSKIVVPTAISDTVLGHAVKFRSKARLPALSFYHSLNGCTITRCAQPLVGLKQKRSAQDERFISCIFTTTSIDQDINGGGGGSGAMGGGIKENLIVDARPTTNAMAQAALGAGSEIMENYKGAKKVYLGIDNIHVMRDSLNKVVDALRYSDVSPLAPSQEALAKSGWLRHISIILEGAILIANQVHYKFSHVVVHCSDGWDRTPQLTSLAQIFLDPYFRTLDGFIILVEKEWLSFGHRFAERSGHLSSEKHFTQVSETGNSQAQQVFNSVSNKLVKQSHVKYTSPVFHQFLDCVYQTIRQHPTRFEYNERFLRRLLYHSYSCQYGTFLFDDERERVQAGVSNRTRSVWDYLLARKKDFLNPNYEKVDEKLSADNILLPDFTAVKWWPEAFGRTEEDMNPADRPQTFGSPVRSPMPSSRATPIEATETTVSESSLATPVEMSSTSSADGDSGNRTADKSELRSPRLPATELPASSPSPNPSSPNRVRPFQSTLVRYGNGSESEDVAIRPKFDSMTLDVESDRGNHDDGNIFQRFAQSGLSKVG